MFLMQAFPSVTVVSLRLAYCWLSAYHYLIELCFICVLIFHYWSIALNSTHLFFVVLFQPVRCSQWGRVSFNNLAPVPMLLLPSDTGTTKMSNLKHFCGWDPAERDFFLPQPKKSYFQLQCTVHNFSHFTLTNSYIKLI